MPKAVLVIATALIVVIGAAWIHTRPVAIKQAEDLIKKAEAGKVTVAFGEEAVIVYSP